MTTKTKLHRLVDELPEREVGAAERYLEYLRDVSDFFVRVLAEAPEEEKELSEAGRAALEDGQESARKGEVRPLEEYLAERQG